MKKLLLIVALSFCFNNGYAKIIVDNEWARLTPNGMGAVYFEIKNTNNEDDFLIQASSPNAKSVMHQHNPGVVIFLNSTKHKLINEDGSIVNADFKSGDVLWADAATHEGINLENKPIDIVFVELK